MGMHEMIQFFRQMSGKLGSNIYAGIQGQTDPQHISFMRQLQKEMKEKNSLDTPFEMLEAVVFDLETTGFYPEKGDQIISIGAIKMIGDKIAEENTFYSLIHSDIPLPEHITDLTKVKDEDLFAAPPAEEVLLKFYKFINSNILVAHHAKHEQAFMQKLTRDRLRTGFEHRIIDTSFLIRLTDPSIKAIPLEEICHLCGVEVKNRHHALSDAKMTAEVWSYYMKKAREMGYKNLREVYEHLARL